MSKLKILPRLSLVLALLLVLWFLVAMFGAKWGLIDKLTAFGTMTIGVGAIASMVVAVVAAIALIVALVMKPRQGWLSALVALAIPLAVLAGFGQLRSAAAAVPFIYDITTNTQDSPTFSAAIMKERSESGANPMINFDQPLGEQEKWKGNADLADVTAASLIAKDYPQLKTLNVRQSPEEALQAIKNAMEMRGFEDVSEDASAGTVDGTAVVFWYGFEDDIAARVRPGANGGSSIDFRSTSRVGTSDLGVNAQRIEDLSKAVQDRLAKDFPRQAESDDEAENQVDDQTDEEAAPAGESTSEDSE